MIMIGGPLDGYDLASHLNYETLYFQQPWPDMLIFLTPKTGRAKYFRVNGKYQFVGYVEG